MRAIYPDMVRVGQVEKRAGLFMEGSEAPLALYLGLPDGPAASDWQGMVPYHSLSGRVFLKTAVNEPAERFYLVPRPTRVTRTSGGISVFQTDNPDWIVLDLTQVQNDRIAIMAEEGDDLVIAVIDLRRDLFATFTTMEDYDIFLCCEGSEGLPVPCYNEGAYSFGDGDFESLFLPPPIPLPAELVGSGT